MAHAFNPSNQEANLCEFEARLISEASSSPVCATQWDPVYRQPDNQPANQPINKKQ